MLHARSRLGAASGGPVLEIVTDQFKIIQIFPIVGPIQQAHFKQLTSGLALR